MSARPRPPRTTGAAVIALLAASIAGAGPSATRDAASSRAASRTAGPVVVVGLDGADWQLLDGYLADGTMPNLKGLVAGGRSGVLTTLDPPLSPLVWTTMMTGASPLEHRILDFTRRNPASGALEPITADERRVPAVWDIASDAGLRVGVFAMWATYPAPHVNGLVVSDRVFGYLHTTPGPGSVSPTSEQAAVAAARTRAESEVSYETLRGYLPDLARREYDAAAARGGDALAAPVSGLRRILVETRLVHALASGWIARAEPDLAVVYVEGTDAVAHLFAPYAPPRAPAIPEPVYRRYSAVPRRYFSEVDALLGAYRRLLEPRGGRLVVVSDHGFQWGEGRPREVSSVATASAGRWHRDEGIFVLWGRGIEPSAGRAEKASVDRVAATLLALLDLPPGEGLAGPPFGGVRPSSAPPVDYRARFRPSGRAVAAAAPAAPAPDDEALEKLRALGYIGGGGEDARASGGAAGLASTRTAGSWNNEGILLRAAGRREQATAAFERALAMEPANASAAANLSDALDAAGADTTRADALLVTAVAAGLPEGAQRLAGRALRCRKAGQLARSRKLLDGGIASLPRDAGLRLLRGRARLEGDCAGALEDFTAAVRSAPEDAVAWASAGLARLCLGDPEHAAEDLRRSLALDPSAAEVRRTLDALERGHGASRTR